MGERPDSSKRPRSAFALAAVALAALAVSLSACGDDGDDSAAAAEGEYPVRVTTAKFPTEQLLAGAQYLKLGVKNTGDQTIPELAFTITTNNGEADGSFKVQLDDPDLANPNRPVWILEEGFPREAGTPAPGGTSGGLRAQTNTFAFGPLEAGEEKTLVWKLTPVMAGTFTLRYQVSASLDGGADAVTRDGSAAKGEFVVTVSDKPPKQTVNEKGKVVPAD